MESRLLSTWNQAASRVYVRQWHCFPLQRDADLEALETHLGLALDRLSIHLPHLAGKVYLLSNPKGRVYVAFDAKSKITLEILDQRDTFGWTYSELKAEGFPAKAFVHPSFDLPCKLVEDQQGVPVLQIQARIIDGGLLLCIYSHHSVSDGCGIYDYVRAFAELTRDPDRIVDCQDPEDIHRDVVDLFHGPIKPMYTFATFEQLLDLCDEFRILPTLTGPTSPPFQLSGTPLGMIEKTGRIFIIGAPKINDLKLYLMRKFGNPPGGRLPSTFTCLAAVTWAHVTKARLAISSDYLGIRHSDTTPKKPCLTICLDWRRRAYSEIMGESAGNVVALPRIKIDIETIMAACDIDPDIAYPALGILIQGINAAILSVDEDFVALRSALFRKAPDPRLLGLNDDPRDAYSFCFNTWRQFGADLRWKMPGVGNEEGSGTDGIRPDAIRRVQGEWNMGAALLLPGRHDSDRFELLVTLDVDSMEFLFMDQSWMGWVDDVTE